MKVALVYDKLNKWGGAERILLALHELFPSAPLYTSIWDRAKAPWASVFIVHTSFLQCFPFASHHDWYAYLMPLAFESFNFDKYDLVISVTSESGKGIIVRPPTKHLCYSLTPTRYLWSGYNEYFRNPILRLVSKPVVEYLRFWDKVASVRPDKYVSISKEVQGRVGRYYGQDSEVVYPPITLPVVNTFKDNNYFLIVSRLVPYKKIDIAIKVFNRLKLPLKIIGVGSEMSRLRKMAGPTVELLGYLTDKELVRYYSECRALVFPGLEDFGLTILEAQSFGKPVIAFLGGGALETIVEGKTGIFFDNQTVQSLEKAVKQFNNLTFDPKGCVAQAKKFGLGQFKEGFMKEVEDLLR